MGESNLAMKEDAFLMTGGKRTLYLCSHCKRDVTQQLRVQCVECSTEKLPFQLCGDCFAVGMNVNLGNGSLHHLNTHNYRVVDCTDAPIFTSDWSASEELLLLEGIEVHGMGNWKTIAEYVNTNKTAAAVETHYWESYMGRHGYCLPAHTLVQGQAVPTLSLLDPEEEDNSISSNKSAAADDGEKSSKAKSSLARVRLQGGHVLGEEVIRDVGKEALVASLAKEKGPREKLVEQAIRERIASLPGADLPGFMPLREDFDYEYDNNAENLLANMDFDDDDHPSERELKLQIIRIYNKKLDEREARKRFVIDRGIVDFKQQSMLEKKKTKEERDLIGRLRVFARFQTPEEHEALVNGLLLAKKLRGQIELYHHYRAMGIRSIEEAKEYELERKRREDEIKVEKHRKEAPHLFPASSHSSNKSGGASRRGRGGGDASNGEESEGGGGQVKRQRGDEDDLAAAFEELKAAPGASLLSHNELALCAELPMLPMHYLAVKEAIVREACRNGHLNEESIHRVIKISPAEGRKIVDFFVKEIPAYTKLS